MGLASPVARAVLAVAMPYLASERSALHALGSSGRVPAPLARRPPWRFRCLACSRLSPGCNPRLG